MAPADRIDAFATIFNALLSLFIFFSFVSFEFFYFWLNFLWIFFFIVLVRVRPWNIGLHRLWLFGFLAFSRRRRKEGKKERRKKEKRKEGARERKTKWKKRVGRNEERRKKKKKKLYFCLSTFLTFLYIFLVSCFPLTIASFATTWQWQILYLFRFLPAPFSSPSPFFLSLSLLPRKISFFRVRNFSFILGLWSSSRFYV